MAGRPKKEQRFKAFTNCEQELCDIVNGYSSSTASEAKRKAKVSVKLKQCSRIDRLDRGRPTT